MNYIELFAGCGGLSLGFETAGFERLLANEISPMVAETYAYNSLNEDLQLNHEPQKTLWLGSNFPRERMTERLREDPNEVDYASNKTICDLDMKHVVPSTLKGSLLVGDIRALNHHLKQPKSKLKKMLRTAGEVDVVSGGPPCQSFSMAGMRDRENHRNRLPWEFAEFVGSVQPKIALLENVSGILRPFNQDGEQYFAWFEVAKAFAAKNYVPLCLHINAKYVGVAQNRPRFIMLAFREDVAQRLIENSRFTKLVEALKDSMSFSVAAKNDQSIQYGSLHYYDIKRDIDFFSSDLLSDNPFEALMSIKDSELVSVKDAIDDLRDDTVKQSDYVKMINESYINKHRLTEHKRNNHTFRANGPIVKARFRLYQVMNELSLEDSKILSRLLKGHSNVKISSKLVATLQKHWLLGCNRKVLKKISRTTIRNLTNALKTQKHSQRALKQDKPAPAVLASQDDACHYHGAIESLRSLTVREIARIQSFPDWFEFRSKETTGGLKRRYEVPQYTQVGNAVPPKLGKVLGEMCRDILSEI
jgi:DNA (cytosine-5)-methyltransferase 1